MKYLTGLNAILVDLFVCVAALRHSKQRDISSWSVLNLTYVSIELV